MPYVFITTIYEEFMVLDDFVYYIHNVITIKKIKLTTSAKGIRPYRVSWDYMDKGVNKTNRITITNIPTITIVIASFPLYLLFIYPTLSSKGLFPSPAFVLVINFLIYLLGYHFVLSVSIPFVSFRLRMVHSKIVLF